MPIKKEDIPRIEEALKTLSVADLAKRLDKSVHTLRYNLNMLGISSVEIKKQYKIDLLKEMSGKFTVNEMVKKTGFSKSTILNYMRDGHFVSKFSMQKTTPTTPW